MSDITRRPTWSEDEKRAAVLDRYPRTGDPSCHHPASGTHSVLAFPEEVGLFCLAYRRFIAAMRHAIWLADKNDYCSVRFATIPLIRNWRVSTMAAPDGDGTLYAGTFWRQNYNGALLMRIDDHDRRQPVRLSSGHNGPRSARITSGCIPPIRRMAIYRTLRISMANRAKCELFRHFGERRRISGRRGDG